MMTMVGDAYAAPLVEELNRTAYELSSLYAIGTGGAATNPKHVSALLEKLPQLTIINGYGSSETGNMGFGHNQRGSHRETFDLREGGTVVSERYDQVRRTRRAGGRLGGAHRPDPAGLLRRCRRHPQDLPRGRRAARRGVGRPRIARGRRHAAAVTAATRWWSTPAGRRSSSRRSRRYCGHARGSPTRWWSGATASGGGRRSSRSCRPVRSATVDAESLHAACVENLARFKAPKEFIFVDKVRRLGNGKADYRWAKSQATQRALT